ncbi:MAG: hypothetical protein ABW171_01995 [Steroidobacter sp.]
MTQVLLTLAASLVINLAVLGLLKLGLRDGRKGQRSSWGNHQPC